MTLVHPEVKRKIESWQSELRELTGNEALIILAFTPPTQKYQMKELIPIVCEVTGIPVDRLVLRNRQTEVVQARHLLSYFGSLSGINLTVVARELGLTDHSTVIHGRDRIKDLMETGDNVVCDLINKINIKLEERNNAH